MSKGRSSMQGVKLLYIRDYLHREATPEHPKNSKHIINFLETKGITATEKTIYNDLTRLIYDFGEKIEYSARLKGYYIAEPRFKPYELRLMIDCVQASRFITQAEARSISGKIKDLADVYTKDSLNRTALVENRIKSQNESVVREADNIHLAITSNSKIGFRYFQYTPSPDKKKKYYKAGEMYIVSPMTLLWDNGNYYLYAYVSEKEGFKSFRVDRMEKITAPLFEKREGVDEFVQMQREARTKEAKVFSMFHGEKLKVQIRFQNRFANAVIDQFGKNIMLIPDGDKHFYASPLVEISPPFFAWLSTFGKGAKITHPQKAVDEMKKFISNLTEMYKDESGC